MSTLPLQQTKSPRASRQLWIALGLLLSLMIAITVSVQSPSFERAFDLDSSGPDGLLVLRQWLEAMGYTVTTNPGSSFAIPAGTDLLFVYPNQESYNESDAQQLSDWVAAGHTLIIVAVDDPVLEKEWGVVQSSDFGFGPSISARQAQPLFPELPAWLHHVGTGIYLDSRDAPGAVEAVINERGKALAVVQTRGSGIVWHTSRSLTFTNDAFADSQARTIDDLQSDTMALLPALLRTVPESGTIAFDTYHMFGPELPANKKQVESIRDWLYLTPGGWATLFVGVVLLLYLTLQGVRLGPPIPTVQELRRREAAEFVRAMAGLYRQAHLQDTVAHHHKHRFKVALGKPFHLRADLPDGEFLKRLRSLDDRMDDETFAAIREILTGFNTYTNEKDLLKLVSRVDELTRRGEK